MRTSGSCTSWAPCLLVAGSLLGCAGHAQVQKSDPPQAVTERRLYDYARGYFSQQRYRDAADLLEFIYDQNPLTALLQNIGAAYLRLAERAEIDPWLRLCYAERAYERLSRLRALGQGDASLREQVESARALSQRLGQKLGWVPSTPLYGRGSPRPTVSLQLELPSAQRPR